MRIALFSTVMVACLVVAGCGEIQETATVKTTGTRVGNEIVATRGDAIIKVVNKESMPNVFGAADIFGRTRATGTTSLIFVGGSGSTAYFVRRDVSISSQQTTLNSSPIVIDNRSTTNFSGYSGGGSFSGTATTYSAPIFLPPNTPADTVTDVREIPISVSTRAGNNTIAIGGSTVFVVSVTSNELRYTVEE